MRKTSHFNPRSPHGERRNHRRADELLKNFNPRSPHGERPRAFCTPSRRPAHFNPRSPHGERRSLQAVKRERQDFNPRSPHGERRLFSIVFVGISAFQSTLPARGATRFSALSGSQAKISIHAPRTGSDLVKNDSMGRDHNFNPRSPHGERQHWESPKTSGKGISIHAPRTGSDKIKS